MEKLSSGPKIKCEKILHVQLNNVKYLAIFHILKGVIILIHNLKKRNKKILILWWNILYLCSKSFCLNLYPKK